MVKQTMVHPYCGYYPAGGTQLRMSELELGEEDIRIGQHRYQPGTKYQSPGSLRVVSAKAGGGVSDSKWGEEGVYDRGRGMVATVGDW